MKGVYNLNPSQPRYVTTWDTEDVFTFLKKWSPIKNLNISQISMKLAMLILLITGHRGQSLIALNILNMKVNKSNYEFIISNKDLKQGRPGYKPETIKLKAYPVDRRLCVYTYMKAYLDKTENVRGSTTQLFLTLKKPYKGVSRDTISRWLKNVLRLSGIDITHFKPGSTRAASTSKASQEGASIDELLKAAGWSNESTFVKYYKKQVLNKKSMADFVLKQ